MKNEVMPNSKGDLSITDKISKSPVMDYSTNQFQNLLHLNGPFGITSMVDNVFGVPQRGRYGGSVVQRIRV